MKKTLFILIVLVCFLVAVSGANANSRSNSAIFGETVKTRIGNKFIEIELLNANRVGRKYEGLNPFTLVPEEHEILMGKFRIKVTQGVDDSFSLSFADFQIVSGDGYIIPNSIAITTEESLYQGSTNIEFYGTNELVGWTWVLVRIDDDYPKIVYRRGLQGQVWFDPNAMPMIDLKGLGLNTAMLKLTQNMYTLGKVSEVMNVSVPVGTVIEHYPAYGEYVQRGTPINLFVSRYSDKMVRVPDFRGTNINEIKGELSSIGLELGNMWSEPSEVYKENTIIEQNPASGTLVTEKTKVDIIYSQGIEEPVDHSVLGWQSVEVSITVPRGSEQEVVILVLDDFGTREVYRGWNDGGERLVRNVHARGTNAKIEVYIGGQLLLHEALTK